MQRRAIDNLFLSRGFDMNIGPVANSSSLSLNDYLGKCDLSEHLKLTGQLSFHWANWDQTCLAQRKHYKKFNNNYYLTKLNQSLQELKSRPVWLCNKLKVIKSDLYSLYESYLDSRLRLTWFERKDEILFSLESEKGPYFSLTSMKWMDKELYSQFVMKKILVEQYTLRSFRINANIPILFKLNNDVKEYEDKVQIHQLSEFGFIFKIKDKKFLNKIQNSKVLELKIPIGHYQKVLSLTISEAFLKLNDLQSSSNGETMIFKLESRILNFYGNMNSAKRSTEKEFFLFARYEDLIPHGHEVALKQIFEPLVEKTKKHLSLSLLDFQRQSA